jgi:hypothetical protein
VRKPPLFCDVRMARSSRNQLAIRSTSGSGLLRRVAQGPIKLSGDVGGASVLILGAGLAGMTAALK